MTRNVEENERKKEEEIDKGEIVERGESGL